MARIVLMLQFAALVQAVFSVGVHARHIHESDRALFVPHEASGEMEGSQSTVTEERRLGDGVTNLNEIGTQDTELSQQEPQSRKRRCVSIAYNAPAMTGSIAVGDFLKSSFPHAKTVDCGLHTETSSLSMVLLPENAEFDVFSCHSIWNATMISALAGQTKHPLVHVTTIRDPLEQLLSMFYHLQRDVCGSWDVPTKEEILSFVTEFYKPRIPAFYSRPYNIGELSEKLVSEECSYWDVIWRTDQLDVVLGTNSNTDTRAYVRDCPEKAAMLSDPELIKALEEVLEGSRTMYERMKDCENVRTDFGFEWDEEQSCITQT